jgi:uncharacterized protein YqhQ
MGKTIGGQAVIEGVMMMSRKYMAVAVKKGDQIVKTHARIWPRTRFFNLPIIRGVVNLAMMLIFGTRALLWSANQQDEDEPLGMKATILTLLFSISLALALFVALPYFLSSLIVNDKGLIFNLIDGAIRILIFIAYILGISFMEDVKRLFSYHGAEHKTIHCFEEGKSLSIENIQKYSTVHPRCGTSFLMVVLIISILAFSLIKSNYWVFQVLLRILLIPLIAGISYEIIKKAKGGLASIISAPGRWLQKITTKEPTNDQVLVAVESLKRLMELEGKSLDI